VPELARDAGIAVKARHRVDDALETTSPASTAIGECAEHRGVCYGLVEPAHEQARVLAERTERRDAQLRRQRALDQSEGLRRERVLGRRFLGSEGTEEIVLSDPGIGLYKKLVLSRTAGWSARCCSAIPPTGSGISS
jgi:nitrite reductase (NADH) large subunit